MKKLLVTTWMAALTALVGCQQNDEFLTNPEAPTTGGKQITVSAHIQNGGGSRVALTETQDENQNPTVKVEWRKDDNNPETFTLYQMLDVPATASDNTSNDGGAAGGAAGSGDGGASVAVPITFTQANGTNQFTGTVDENYTGTYEAVYGEGNLALQNGTLNQEDCVYMVAENITDLTHPIEFKHQTAILKAVFKLNGSALNLSDISDIVMRNVTPFPGEKSSTITIIPAAQASGNDVYIFLPASSGYSAGHSFTFGVTTTDNNYYEATLTIPANMSVVKGKLYTADMALTTAIPYVTFSALEEQEMVIQKTETLTVNIEYSVNGGNWGNGSVITFGGAHGDLRLRAKSEVGTSSSYTIRFLDATPVACTGDIRTLVDWENYSSANTSNAKFCYLFSGCTQLISAPALPATILAESCYYMMFKDCTQLATAPELPATALAQNCYAMMFRGCTSLTSAPALPATALTPSCYNMMFRGCTQLTSAPELPATSLAYNCYDMMFLGCTSLTTAPVLPATTLAESCYLNMFNGCTNLNNITMLATDITASNCLTNWVNGVAATGTFYKNPAATWTVTGASGIPEGWTVKSYVDPDAPSGGGW